MSSTTSTSMLGQKLFNGKTKTIYSVIDQPNLICIHRKDFHDPASSVLTIPGTRRNSVDHPGRFPNSQQTRLHTNSELNSRGALVTSITNYVYEILRQASMPTFFVAAHGQVDMFIAKKCTMIPILWIIRRFANETYVKRNQEISLGHRFIPPIIEIFYKRHPIVYQRRTSTIINPDDNYESSSDRESQYDDSDSDSDECISSIWSYEQLLNININTDNVKISRTDIEYMYEICCTAFDILEHVWMSQSNCQLIDLKLEFGLTTTKEIVIANVYDIDTWHILRPNEQLISNEKNSIEEKLIWIRNSLKTIVDIDRHSFYQSKLHVDYELNEQQEIDTISLPSKTSRCIIICSSLNDIEYGQQMKTTLNEIYNIQCDIRLFSIYKSTQTILKFLSNYSYEHCRSTVFITLGSINNGLATCLSSNSQYPIIHCSIQNLDQQNNLIDMNSFVSHDTLLFTIVFSLSSAVQNVIQILAMNDWRLWAKQRGRRFKKHMDLILADQQLILNQTMKPASVLLIDK